MLRSDPGSSTGFDDNEDRSFGRGMVRPQTGDESQHGGLAAA